MEIPHTGSTRELVQRVIDMFHIPVYLEDGKTPFSTAKLFEVQLGEAETFVLPSLTVKIWLTR